MIVIGRALRDYTQETIKMGGRPSEPWTPLSRWTVSRTGRTQALKGIDRYIRYRASSNVAELYAVDTGKGYDVEQHHRGWYIPPREFQTMRGMLAGRKLFFTRAKGAHVPGRPFWPTYAEAATIAEAAVSVWVADGARKKWH